MDQHKRILKEWLKKQQHLPQNIHEKLLERFLQCCDNSIEQAKQILEKYFTIRSQIPEVFDDRDPSLPAMQECLLETYQFISLPKMTEKRQRVVIYNLLTDDPEKYNYVPGSKASMLFEDARLLEEEIADEELFLFDMKNFTIRHLPRIVLSTFKKYLTLVQEAFPVKRTQIHLYNVPTYLDKIMMFFRPFLTSEALSIMHVHLPGSETIYEYIPRDILPVEYGGTAGNCLDINKYWVEKIMQNKDYLLDPSRWKVDDSKRSQNVGSNQLFGTDGSFRRLDID